MSILENQSISLDIFQANAQNKTFGFTEIQNQKSAIGVNISFGITANLWTSLWILSLTDLPPNFNEYR